MATTTTPGENIASSIYGIITVLVTGFIIYKVSSDTGTQIALIILVLGLLIFLS